MKRLALAVLLLASGGFATGCRSAYTPYDYSPPVADSQYQTNGGRAGSNLSAPAGYQAGGDHESLESFEEPDY